MSLFNEILTDRSGNKVDLKKIETLLPVEKKGDEIDVINAQNEEFLSTRLNERNVLFLKKVEAAKQKILEGTYGMCEECGAEISQARLLARPTACLCIGCQEEKEKMELGSIKHRRDLNKSAIAMESEEFEAEKKYASFNEVKFESVIDF
jgi:DnaK suppressor protein